MSFAKVSSHTATGLFTWKIEEYFDHCAHKKVQKNIFTDPYLARQKPTRRHATPSKMMDRRAAF